MSNYPTHTQARQDILEAGRRLYGRGMVAANDGNISVRVSDETLLITPTNVSKGFMTEDMLILLSLDGRVLGGERAPSSEAQMHLAIYRANPALRAVVHAHPPVATAYAIGARTLDVSLVQEAALLLGPIPVASYAPPGSRALADGAAALCRAHRGALLARHGAVCWGANIWDALGNLERLEHTATILMHAGLLGITGAAHSLDTPEQGFREKQGGGALPSMADAPKDGGGVP